MSKQIFRIFGLSVGQNNQFEDITVSSGKLW